MSLRGRLLAGMVALVAVGLGVAAVLTYEEQRSFLLHRVDQQVQSVVGPAAVVLRLAPGRRPGAPADRASRLKRLLGSHARPPRPGVTSLPPGSFAELLGPGRQVIRRRTFSNPASAAPTPRLPAHLPLSRPGSELRVFTITGSGGAGYRAAAFAVGTDTAVVAVPLREANDTLHRLVEVEVLVAGGVILGLIALGWFAIRIGLLPLERIGRVAAEIADGDLSRRVTPADPRTEIGRLGRSLNEMLGQIEQAFADRRDSEDRLRQFLADASHELRTPLASIRGYAELFRLGAVEDPMTLERAMARIESEAARMGVLVEDLLALASLDQAPEPRRVAVDVRELVEQAAEDLRLLAPDRDVTVDAAGPAPVLGDPEQLRRLLANLTGNAAVHTPAGTPVEIGVRSGRSVTVVVRDHGPGIPDAAAERLFERFWRVGGGRERGPGGAGLGLAIARGIARAHGGEVRAENAPDGGAVFTVSLPAAQEEPEGPSQQTLSVLTAGSYPGRPQ